MKRIIISMLIASALFGCQEQIEELDSASKAEVFEAYIEEFTTATKTSLTQTNNVVWSENDHVAIFQGSSIADKYKVTSSSVGSTNGKFTIEADNSGEVNGDFVSGNEFPTNVALYPYADNLSCSNGQLNEDNVASYVIDGIVLPQIQSYTEKSFGEEAFPMVAVTNGLADHTLRFKNACGAMKLQFKGTDAIQSITIEGRNGEKLSGSATLTIYPTNAAPAIELSQNAPTSVTLDCGEGVQLNEETATSFIISLPPVAFTQGFKVIITKTNGETKKIETASTNTVFRSSILVMPELTIESSETGDTPGPDDYVDEYGINHGPGVEIDGVVWAPVNCGYHATDYQWGKLYQWGRKYGQGYEGSTFDVNGNNIGNISDVITPNLVEGPVSLATGNLENNSNVFYIDTDYTDEDWLISHNDMLWNKGSEHSPVKTEYDPCPEGWRVPTYNELNDVCKNRSDWTTNELNPSGSWLCGTRLYSAEVPQVFFPASGFRDYGDGSAMGRGLYSFYWTSKQYSTYNAYSLYLRGGASMSGNMRRANGIPVRCVKDKPSSDLPVEPEVPSDSQYRYYIDEYGINRGPGVKINGVIWAPVNCGYHAPDFQWGKLYQWGRKYGQGYSGKLYDINGKAVGETSDASIPTFVEGPVSITIGNSEDSSNVFYSGNFESHYDWLWPNDDLLWNSGTEDSPVKTEYDPCPEGWRVPTYNELNDVCKNRSDWTTNVSDQPGFWFYGATGAPPRIFFPAGGSRYSDYTAGNRGRYGFYWSSKRKYYLDFSHYDVNIYSGSIINGRTVRCVQE